MRAPWSRRPPEREQQPAPAEEGGAPVPPAAEVAPDPSPGTPGTPGTPGARASSDARPPRAVFALEPTSVWRAAWIVVAVVALAVFARFVLADGAPVLFTALMAFFTACAMEPAVSRLARHMRRGLAAGLVMILVAVLLTVFVAAFGGMLRDQLVSLVQQAPAMLTTAVQELNRRFDLQLDQATIADQLDLSSERMTALAAQLAGGLLGFVTSLLSTFLNGFAYLLFTFYLSADWPRLRAWVAGLFPPRQQRVVLSMWEIGLVKIGGYVSARLVLATINAAAMGVFMWWIDLPYWLPLAIWTGLVAQFVPNVGTYISIVLPVLVGLVSPEPRDGIWVLAYAVAYQQVENIFIEPRISARAVDVHPAVAFGSALLGGALFGASGALLGVPVGATIMALFDLYKRRYELSDTAEAVAAAAAQGRPVEDAARQEADARDL